MNLLKSIIALVVISCTVAQPLSATCIYEKVIQGEELAMGVMLKWSTEIEIDNSMFIVEKSMDGVDFTDIGTVEGAGNSNEIKEYNFLDVMASAKRLYYRLKQVNYDGTFDYSDVLSIDKQGENQFMVVRMSSVAAKEKFDVTLSSSKEGKMAYTLFDAQGDVVEDGNMAMLNGLNYLNINMMDKATGIYKLQMQMGEEKETLTFKKSNEADFNLASKNRKN